MSLTNGVFGSRAADLQSTVDGNSAFAFDLIRHLLNDQRELLFKRGVGDSRASNDSAENPNVRISMNGHALKACIDAEDIFEHVAEGVVVHAVTCVEEGAIDVEEVGIGGAPVEVVFVLHDSGT